MSATGWGPLLVIEDQNGDRVGLLRVFPGQERAEQVWLAVVSADQEVVQVSLDEAALRALAEAMLEEADRMAMNARDGR